jgi:ankyrin repeat protein
MISNKSFIQPAQQQPEWLQKLLVPPSENEVKEISLWEKVRDRLGFGDRRDPHTIQFRTLQLMQELHREASHFAPEQLEKIEKLAREALLLPRKETWDTLASSIVDGQALEKAISEGNFASVIDLLSQAPSFFFNNPLPNGELPLHFAIRQNQQEVALWLLGHGADCRQGDWQGLSAIDHTVLMENEAIFTAALGQLLHKGQEEIQKKLQAKDPNLDLHHKNLLEKMSTVAALYQTLAETLGTTDDKLQKVQIEQKADFRRRRLSHLLGVPLDDYKGRSAKLKELYALQGQKDQESRERLAQLLGTTDPTEQQNKITIIDFHKQDLTKFLKMRLYHKQLHNILKDAAPSEEGKGLHLAIICGDWLKVVKELNNNPELRAKIIAQKDSDGDTALHYAAATGKLALVDWLIRLKENPAVPDKHGLTAIDLLGVVAREIAQIRDPLAISKSDMVFSALRMALWLYPHVSYSILPSILPDWLQRVEPLISWAATIYASLAMFESQNAMLRSSMPSWATQGTIPAIAAIGGMASFRVSLLAYGTMLVNSLLPTWCSSQTWIPYVGNYVVQGSSTVGLFSQAWRATYCASASFDILKKCWSNIGYRSAKDIAFKAAVQGINLAGVTQTLCSATQTLYNGLFPAPSIDPKKVEDLKKLSLPERLMDPDLDPSNPEHALLILDPNLNLQDRLQKYHDLKEIFKEYALKFHPDKGGNSTQYARFMDAWQTIRDASAPEYVLHFGGV